MIMVRIKGGLGNQMFQYALGRRLALQLGVPLKLDISWYETQFVRRYLLDRFQISASVASKQEVSELLSTGRGGFYGQIANLLERWRPVHLRRYIQECRPGFDPKVLQANRHAYLDGYWQSEKYFHDIADVLHAELLFKEQPLHSNKDLLKMIEVNNSVSLHIRRGDYISDPAASRVLGFCGGDYYQKCIQILAGEIVNPFFFVFSDDMEWARKNLAINHSVEYVENGPVDGELVDFSLMKACKHHIIANSSFSWWAAWLCLYPDKEVLAPQRWFNDISINSQDLVPDPWRSV